MNIQKAGAEYTFSWPEEGLALRVFGVRETRDGDIHAQVEPFEVVGDQLRALAGPTKGNLSGARGKTELANLLSRRRKLEDPEQWSDIVEQVASHVFRDHRAGTPLVELSTIEAEDALPYLVRPYLPLNELTVLYGDGAAGKSVLAAALALSVRTGSRLPHCSQASQNGPILYLDWETHGSAQSRRFRRVAEGLSVRWDNGLFYRHCERPILDDAEALAGEVARREIKLVVVDSLAWACGGDPSDPQVAIASLAAIRRLGCTALVIAHSPKGEREQAGRRSIFGSAFFEFGPRSAWEVRATRDGNTLRQALYHRKANDDELLTYPLGQTLTFTSDPNAITLTAVKLEAGDELAAGASHIVRLRQALIDANRPLTVAELAEELELKDNAVRAMLSRGQSFVKIDDGKTNRWAVKTVEEPTPPPIADEQLEMCIACKRSVRPYSYTDDGFALCRSCAA